MLSQRNDFGGEERLYPFLNSFSISGSFVLDIVSFNNELKSGISLNSYSFGSKLALSGINLSDDVLFSLGSFSQFLILRS